MSTRYDRQVATLLGMAAMTGMYEQRYVTGLSNRHTSDVPQVSTKYVEQVKREAREKRARKKHAHK